MCFVSKKKLNKIETELTELTRIVKNREYQALKEDSKDLKEIKALLEDIHIKVDEVKTVLDQDTMEEIVIVKYSLPSVMLKFDENGNPYKDNLFYALNALNLISLDDMNRIRKHLDDIKSNRN